MNIHVDVPVYIMLQDLQGTHVVERQILIFISSEVIGHARTFFKFLTPPPKKKKKTTTTTTTKSHVLKNDANKVHFHLLHGGYVFSEDVVGKLRSL